MPGDVVIYRGRHSRIPRDRRWPATCRDFGRGSVEDTRELVHHAGGTVRCDISDIVGVVNEWPRGRSAGQRYFCVDGRVTGPRRSRSGRRGAVAGSRGEFQYVKVGSARGKIILAECDFLPVQGYRNQTGYLACALVIREHDKWPRSRAKARSAGIGVQTIQPDDVSLRSAPVCRNACDHEVRGATGGCRHIKHKLRRA